MRDSFRATLVLSVGILFLLPKTAPGQDLTIGNYSLVSKERVGQTRFTFSYRADVINTGGDAYGVVAYVTSQSPHTSVVDGDLNFGDVPSGVAVTSGDTFTICQDGKHAFEPSALGWEVQTVAHRVAAGAMGFLRAIIAPLDETNGLPRNEAKQSELPSGHFQSRHFVPAQLGTWVAAAVLSHALREKNPSFTAGFTTEELLAHIDAAVTSLENIVENHAFTDPTTGKKALYQVHNVPNGEASRSSPFEKTVSLLDNAFLVAGLRACSSYLADIDPPLSSRIAVLLNEFDFGMWVVDSDMHIGGSENPRSGSVVDRIVSESRLAVVVARARGELSPADFQSIVLSMRSKSASGSTPGGVRVDYLPFNGTALEIWSVTPFLSNELSTRFGSGALLPLVDAWEETRMRIGLPAAGATGVAGGRGSFRLFALSPAEHSSQLLDSKVLVPPAAGIQAGAVGSAEALQNLERAFTVLKGAGKFHDEFGVPNYMDFGTDLVNEADPVRGTLEVGQMAVALLNYLLGGKSLENLLRRNEGWSSALDEYAVLLNTIL